MHMIIAIHNDHVRMWTTVRTDENSEADPGFSFGGGGAQKIMYPHAHYERRTELTFGRGPGPAYILRTLEALGLFQLMLSRAI